MSFQITVMKVLAGHPGGRASVAELKQYVAVLICSGTDWSQRMKHLAARAPGLDIFSSRYVIREPSGWQITEAGFAFLTSIETPAPEPALDEQEVFRPSATASAPDLRLNVIEIADYAVKRRRSAA